MIPARANWSQESDKLESKINMLAEADLSHTHTNTCGTEGEKKRDRDVSFEFVVRCALNKKMHHALHNGTLGRLPIKNCCTRNHLYRP